MASKTRSSDGCWTCRLRRKKCDEVRPVCNGCAALEIDCLYSEERPEWMDTIEKQKEKGEWLKQEVKRKANLRRERRYLQTLELGLESLDVSQTDDSDPGHNPARTTPEASTHSSSSSVRPRDSTSVSSGPPPDHSPLHGLTASTSPFSDGQDAVSQPSEMVGIQERELSLIIMYLDYVFPFLYPFYRPLMLDAGRGWLLVLFSRNKALLHTALSLATYFFHVVLSSCTYKLAQQGQECKNHNSEELQRQQDLALRELQSEMQAIVARGVKGYLAETNRVMASIIQLLTFEVAIANTGNWEMHLDAATELFTLIIKEHGTVPGTQITCFTNILVQLGSQPFIYTHKHHPWSAEQASLRFFTAFLLFFDTLAATSLEIAPRLQQCHQHLLTEPDEEMRKSMPESEKEHILPHIDLKEFMGLPNWVLTTIGEIAALDAWKKEMKKNGSLSVAQLVSRATAIEQSLHCHIVALKAAQDAGPAAPLDPLMELISRPSLHPGLQPEVTSLMARIWAQASLTYLSVVVSGWQPASLEIRDSVKITTQMLLGLSSPNCLRTLVWPFTITGCMAALEEEQTFRDLVSVMGPMLQFGTIAKSLTIMEQVWANRAHIEENADQWDLAACFKILGHPALLV